MTEGRGEGNWETKSKRKRDWWGMKDRFKEWQNEEGKETERRQGRKKGMMRHERLIYRMTEGRRKGNWETTRKRKRNDEEWNMDLRNDRRKKERKLRDDKEKKKEWWGMKDWFKKWQREEGKETGRRQGRENGNDEEWKIDLRNDWRKKLRKLRDEK